MSIMIANHIQSNKILDHATHLYINIYDNVLSFDTYFEEDYILPDVDKWYSPTVKKFFYTICKRNLDQMWNVILLHAPKKDPDTSLSVFMEETLERHPDSVKKFRFENIQVKPISSRCLNVMAEMRFYFFDEQSVEILDFIPSQMRRELLEQMLEELKLMTLDATNFGIKSGFIKPG